ncbi:MAG: ABC transporter permease subunit, partial [Albidovulum sp.]
MTFDFGAIWDNRDILIDGVLNTLLISVIAIPIGRFLGVVVCLARISKNRLLRWTAIAYIELMRNIPLLILI